MDLHVILYFFILIKNSVFYDVDTHNLIKLRRLPVVIPPDNLYGFLRFKFDEDIFLNRID